MPAAESASIAPVTNRSASVVAASVLSSVVPSRTTAPVIVSAPAVVSFVVDSVPFRRTESAVIEIPPSRVVTLFNDAFDEPDTVNDSTASVAPTAPPSVRL